MLPVLHVSFSDLFNHHGRSRISGIKCPHSLDTAHPDRIVVSGTPILFDVRKTIGAYVLTRSGHDWGRFDVKRHCVSFFFSQGNCFDPPYVLPLLVTIAAIIYSVTRCGAIKVLSSFPCRQWQSGMLIT